MKKWFLTCALMVASVLGFSQTCTTGVAPKFTSAAIVAFTEGVAGSFAVAASGVPTPTVTESGALPTGVAFNGSSIAGTPAPGTAGSFNITLTATNGTLPNDTQNISITVQPAQTGGFWQPTSQSPISWQWQISTVPSAANLLNVQVYDIDGEAATTALVSAMHARGIKAICYLSAGTYENWRSDAKSFPASVKGKTNGWPGENWLDIRNLSVLSPIMTARFQNCKSKGFDAIEPDNIDGYTNSTGFPLTATNQITYNKFLADTAHSLGLSILLKNDGDQAAALEPYFDFGLVEECGRYSECNLFFPFRDANKAVFAAEYRSGYCTTLNNDNFNGAIFDLNLTGKRTPCR